MITHMFDMVHYGPTLCGNYVQGGFSIDGTAITSTTAKYKYCSDPMAEYLDCIGQMGADEETGSVEWDVHVMRFGKRLLFTDGQGFVWCEREDSEAYAMARFSTIDRAYADWSDGYEDIGSGLQLTEEDLV